MSSSTPWATSLGLGGACALVVIACATSDDLSAEPVGPSAATPDAIPPSAASDATDARDASAAEAHVAKRCSEGGFCYVSVPITAPLGSVSASSIDDAWMTTYFDSSLLHWDGKLLASVYEYSGSQPASVRFVSIWAEKKDNVWAMALDENYELFVVRFSPPVGGGKPAFRELRTGQRWAGKFATWVTPASDELWTTTVTSAGESVILRLHEDASGALITDRFRPDLGVEDGRSYSWTSIWGFGPNDLYAGGVALEGTSTTGRGVLAHYDGTSWSVTVLGSSEIASLHGTPPGQPRQLWYHVESQTPVQPISTYLVPILDGDAVGAPIFTNTMTTSGCSSRIGKAVTPSSGWFSNGLLVCQWSGTKLEPVTTALSGGAVITRVNGIWADRADDVWVVGTAAPPNKNFPPTGFAILRTRAVDGGTP
jgi:hypothetical protein